MDTTKYFTPENETAEDSSYDSDNDSTDSTYSSHHQKASSISHSDISRTPSDTLASEFTDYVTISQQQTPYEESSQRNSGKVQWISDDSSDNYHLSYIARVDFALKLGYTESLVQTALQKLGPEPGQDELLAELIKLGSSPSKFSENEDNFAIGSNEELINEDNSISNNLRAIVIDGSNVAMSHGNQEVFSCRGIKICIDWFRTRGHREITVFVPKWRKESPRPDNPIADQEILSELERDRLLVFTPSRLISGKRMVCYDDRYILRLAVEVDGIVVSNDNYRDLAQENLEFRRIVEERILMYSFVNDRFMPPDDPLGRSGPTLDKFLRIIPRRTDILPCPYAKKCTYGNKCKFHHPERSDLHKSVTEQLVEHARRHIRARGPSLSLPLPNSISTPNTHPPLSRAKSSTAVDKDKGVSRTNSCSKLTTPFDPVNMHRKLHRQMNPNSYYKRYYYPLPQPNYQSSSSNLFSQDRRYFNEQLLCSYYQPPHWK